MPALRQLSAALSSGELSATELVERALQSAKPKRQRFRYP